MKIKKYKTYDTFFILPAFWLSINDKGIENLTLGFGYWWICFEF